MGRRLPGYTLIELLMVLAIIATLLSIVAPRYFTTLNRARDTTLRTNLKTIRIAIDRYHGDTGRYPESLAHLARLRYLNEVPIDPVTERTDTWIELTRPCVQDEEHNPCRALTDVRSGASGVGSNGVEFAKW